MKIDNLPASLRGIFLCIIAISQLFLQAGCQKKSNKELSSHSTERKNGWLYANLGLEPTTFDFRKSSNRGVCVLSEMLYEGLLKIDHEGTIWPAQAESVEISPDGLFYTFHLRDTYWSDGEPVLAREFASSWLDNLDPNFPSVYPYLFYCIKNALAAKEGRCSLAEVGIRAENEKTLVVELEQPTAYFLRLMTSPWCFPIHKKLLDGKSIEEKRGFQEGEMVSNGPFVLHKWQPRDCVEVVKNSRYRAAEEVSLEGIHISLIDDENTAAELYESGSLDLLGMPFSAIPGDLARVWKNDLVSNPVGTVTICCFNTTRFPFQNAKLRRAFSLAIDRRQLIDVLYPSAYAPAFTLVPKVFLPAKGSEYVSVLARSEEIDQARLYFKQALEELGIDPAHFPSLRLSFHMSRAHTLFQKLAEIMQQDWKGVLGVTVELEGLEVQSVIQKMSSKKYDASLISWSSNYQDPMCFFEKFLNAASPKNYPGWHSEAFNEVIAKANGVLDAEKRAEFLWQAEKIIQEEAPCASLFHWSYPIVFNDRVQSVYMSPGASIDYTKLKMTSRAYEPQSEPALR